MATDMAATSLSERFGARVRDLREQRSLTQTDLAKLIGMRQPDLCDLEKGRHSPTLSTIERIAKALHVAASDLI